MSKFYDLSIEEVQIINGGSIFDNLDEDGDWSTVDTVAKAATAIGFLGALICPPLAIVGGIGLIVDIVE